jgi:hypothetical protein
MRNGAFALGKGLYKESVGRRALVARGSLEPGVAAVRNRVAMHGGWLIGRTGGEYGSVRFVSLFDDVLYENQVMMKGSLETSVEEGKMKLAAIEAIEVVSGSGSIDCD